MSHTDTYSLTRHVIEEIADAENTSITDLPPLYNVIDPERLNNLFRDDVNATVTFPYHGYTVTAHSDGTIELDDT